MPRPTASPLGARVAVLVAVASLLAAPSRAAAQEDTVPDPAAETTAPPATTVPPSTVPGPVPLVPVPVGCTAPEMPDVVFVGTLVARDFRTGRFRIEQVRAGDNAPFSADGVIDVRYGFDVDYLEIGEQYLVSARRDPVLGVLASKIRQEAPSFGGDEVIGVSESDVECPVFDDPVRTLFPDGSTVESGVLAPFLEDRTRLLGAFLLPLGVALAVVFVLAALRLSLAGVARGVGAVVRRPR